MYPTENAHFVSPIMCCWQYPPPTHTLLVLFTLPFRGKGRKGTPSGLMKDVPSSPSCLGLFSTEVFPPTGKKPPQNKQELQSYTIVHVGFCAFVTSLVFCFIYLLCFFSPSVLFFAYKHDFDVNRTDTQQIEELERWGGWVWGGWTCILCIRAPSRSLSPTRLPDVRLGHTCFTCCACFWDSIGPTSVAPAAAPGQAAAPASSEASAGLWEMLTGLASLPSQHQRPASLTDGSAVIPASTSTCQQTQCRVSREPAHVAGREILKCMWNI